MKWLWLFALTIGCGYHEYAIPDASAGTDEATSAQSADESTSGAGNIDDDEIVAACRGYCDMLWRCDPGPPFPTVESCEDSCEQDLLAAAPDDCSAAQLALRECLAALECDDYFAFVNATPAGAFPCADEASIIVPLCS